MADSDESSDSATDFIVDDDDEEVSATGEEEQDFVVAKGDIWDGPKDPAYRPRLEEESEPEEEGPSSTAHETELDSDAGNTSNDTDIDIDAPLRMPDGPCRNLRSSAKRQKRGKSDTCRTSTPIVVKKQKKGNLRHISVDSDSTDSDSGDLPSLSEHEFGNSDDDSNGESHDEEQNRSSGVLRSGGKRKQKVIPFRVRKRARRESVSSKARRRIVVSDDEKGVKTVQTRPAKNGTCVRVQQQPSTSPLLALPASSSPLDINDNETIITRTRKKNKGAVIISSDESEDLPTFSFLTNADSDFELSQIAKDAEVDSAAHKAAPGLEKKVVEVESADSWDDSGVDAADLSKAFDDFENSQGASCGAAVQGCSGSASVESSLSVAARPTASERPHPSPADPLRPQNLAELDDHVLENIFCQVPVLDLLLQVRCVCPRWRDLIGQDKFLTWKKRYHRLKRKVPGSSQLVAGVIVEKFGGQKLAGIVRYMSDFKPITSKNMCRCLSQHSQWSSVRKLFQLSQFKDHHVAEIWGAGVGVDYGAKKRKRKKDFVQVPNPWCAIAALAVLSRDVSDVSEILYLLLGPWSECTAVEVTECLYCVATFALYFERQCLDGPWTKIHYRVFYALYQYENRYSLINPDPAAFLRLRGRAPVAMTHEQIRVVKHDVKDEEIVKIVAFPGTGKTTTMVQYVNQRPTTRFLVLLFNKSVQMQAEKLFPSALDRGHNYVHVKTSHSLAMTGTNRRYIGKLSSFGLETKVIKEELSNGGRVRPGFTLSQQATLVIKTLGRFFSSADETVNSTHVPRFIVKTTTHLGQVTEERIQLSSGEKQALSKDAEYLWAKLRDPEYKSLRISHDGYLKAYQLSKPDLSFTYDVIILDEAQDQTPALMDILLGQSIPKILVGDPRQQIYSFRGAVNALAQVSASKTFYLTRSFRFGPEIASVASSCLQVLHSVHEQTLVGTRQPGTVDGSGAENCRPMYVIARTKHGLFSEITKCMAEHPGSKIHVLGGETNKNSGLDIQGIKDIYLLKHGRRAEIKDKKFVGKFYSLEKLEEVSIENQDLERLQKIKIVKSHDKSLLEQLDDMLHIHTQEKDADYIFTTAHKAKGLEFENVKISDDFIITNTMREVQDERNLIYVALTRAKTNLIMSVKLAEIIGQTGMNFHQPILTRGGRLSLVKNPYTTADGRSWPRKVLSLADISRKQADWQELLIDSSATNQPTTAAQH